MIKDLVGAEVTKQHHHRHQHSQVIAGRADCLGLANKRVELDKIYLIGDSF